MGTRCLARSICSLVAAQTRMDWISRTNSSEAPEDLRCAAAGRRYGRAEPGSSRWPCRDREVDRTDDQLRAVGYRPGCDRSFGRPWQAVQGAGVVLGRGAVVHHDAVGDLRRPAHHSVAVAPIMIGTWAAARGARAPRQLKCVRTWMNSPFEGTAPYSTAAQHDTGLFMAGERLLRACRRSWPAGSPGADAQMMRSGARSSGEEGGGNRPMLRDQLLMTAEPTFEALVTAA